MKNIGEKKTIEKQRIENSRKQPLPEIVTSCKLNNTGVV